jgi:hypothetical protein
MVLGVRLAAETFTRLRLRRLAHFGYSTIFNLHYWRGVADELGGRRAFVRKVVRRAKPWPHWRRGGKEDIPAQDILSDGRSAEGDRQKAAKPTTGQD